MFTYLFQIFLQKFINVHQGASRTILALVELLQRSILRKVLTKDEITHR